MSSTFTYEPDRVAPDDAHEYGEDYSHPILRVTHTEVTELRHYELEDAVALDLEFYAVWVPDWKRPATREDVLRSYERFVEVGWPDWNDPRPPGAPAHPVKEARRIVHKLFPELYQYRGCRIAPREDGYCPSGLEARLGPGLPAEDLLHSIQGAERDGEAAADGVTEGTLP